MSYDEEDMIKRKAEKLADAEHDIRELSSKFGLEPYEVNNWLVDYDEINKLRAYGGFKERYPHWRWGMMYDKISKESRYFNSAPYEMVINSDPSHAYLQESNDEVIQKFVMAHVDGHSDFFANNKWFKLLSDAPSAVEKLSEHADRIREYMNDPEIDRSEVERWIDNILTIEYNINQYKPEAYVKEIADKTDEARDMKDVLKDKGFSEDVIDEVFDTEGYVNEESENKRKGVPEEPERDLLKFLEQHGMAYDEEEGRAFEMEEWQKDVIRMVRAESFYFAPQIMTKTMNEGWAAYWHTKAMAGENFAEDEEFIRFAITQSKVISGGVSNPYKIGKELWEYLEKKENRKEIYGKLLHVDGVNENNIYSKIDFEDVYDILKDEELLDIRFENVERIFERDDVIDSDNMDIYRKLYRIYSETPGEGMGKEDFLELVEDIDEGLLDELELPGEKTVLKPDDIRKSIDSFVDVEEEPWKLLNYEGMASRHYCFNDKNSLGFLKNITEEELDNISRLGDTEDLYSDVKEAIRDVDKTVGWNRMYEVRANYNDSRFIDEFLTQEFVDRNQYFAYENLTDGENHIPIATSTKADDVKKKMLLKTVNFGKPTIKVKNGNYNNKGELLLEHDYNGIELNLDKAEETLKFVYNLWGRDVHLKTIMKERDEEYIEEIQREVSKIVMASRQGMKLDNIDLPVPEEKGVRITFDGDEVKSTEIPWEEVSEISAEEIDYSTIPDKWTV